MENYEMNQIVGNLKSGKMGKLASGYIKANSGDFNGFIVLTDRYGYEIWHKDDTVVLPLVFTEAASTVKV